jgi:hypothetical protein
VDKVRANEGMACSAARFASRSASHPYDFQLEGINQRKEVRYVGIDMDGMRAAWCRIRLDRIGYPVLVLADGFPGHLLTLTWSGV